MTHSTPSTQIIKSPWHEALDQLIAIAQEEILLVSPFVKNAGAQRVISNLRGRGVDQQVRVTLVTNLRPESVLGGSIDIEALSSLGRAFPRFDLIHLPSLHAKVYVADTSMAVVTSANLTEPGITGNLEYGVSLTDQAAVKAIRRDFDEYARLGAAVASGDLQTIAREMEDLKAAFVEAQRSIRRQARQVFRDRLQAARLGLMRQRAKGKTTHAILAETILFLLARGSLRTVELHPLIQQLHPDICNDEVDRVIGGVRFGKRWKHEVRTAQAHLKRAGRIHNNGSHWYLTETPSVD